MSMDRVRQSPHAQFTEALRHLEIASGGKVDAIVAEAKTPVASAQAQSGAGAPPPVEKAVLDLQAAVAALNGQWGEVQKTLPEWYQLITGRTADATTPVTFTSEQVSERIKASAPHFEALGIAYGDLSKLGHSRKGVADWDAAVGAAHKQYILEVNALCEQLGPLDAARRAGQLGAADGAQTYEAIQDLASYRNAVRQMGLVY